MSDMDLGGILAACPGKRVLVVGDLILDEYLWGEAKRISPEAPVPVVELRSRTYVPGGAANAAANVASLRGVARLVGVVGRDPGAARLAEALHQAGVDVEGLIGDPGRMTTTKTRIIAHSQQVVRFDAEQRHPLSQDIEDSLLRWADRALREVDACILSDYAKGVLGSRVAAHVVAAACKEGKPVVVDPKSPDYGKFRGATLIKPNVHEAARFVKQENLEAEGLLDAGQMLVEALDGTAVLITRGSDGMSLFRSGEAPIHIPTVARKVFDVTGAGDTVTSTLALALAAGADLVTAVHLANRAAGIVVGKVGTAAVTLAELREAVS